MIFYSQVEIKSILAVAEESRPPLEGEVHKKIGRSIQGQKQKEKNYFKKFHSELLIEGASPLSKHLTQGVKGEDEKRSHHFVPGIRDGCADI